MKLARAVSCMLLFVLASCEESPPEPEMCVPPAATACALDLGMELPLTLEEDTTTELDAFGDASCAEGGGAGVLDIAFQWTAPRAGNYVFSTEGTRFDTVLTLRRASCGGEEIACNDDAIDTQSRIAIDLEECETIVIVVDGFGPRDVGPVTLTVSGRESTCDDGMDDDGDGLIDCADAQDCRTRNCIETGPWPQAWSDFEWDVLEETNRNRAQGANCGGEEYGPVPALEMDEVVRTAARLHSQDMGAQNYFDHDSLDGRTFTDRMAQAGFTGAGPWGENIAAGQSTPEEVVQGWMESPGHCTNIMSPAYRVIGIGYAFESGSAFGHYWTQDFGASH